MSDLELYVGEVVWFNASRGYGFIKYDVDGAPQKDMFAHFSDIVCEGFKTLHKGQKVQFNVGQNKHGDPKAVNIVIVKNWLNHQF